MKKLLFVAFLGALVACGETTTEETVETPVVEVPTEVPAVIDSANAVIDSASAVIDSASAAH